MEEKSRVLIPESLRKARDAFDHDRFVLHNLLLAFRHTSLWEKEHPFVSGDDTTEGADWSTIFETTIQGITSPLSVRVADMKNAAMDIVSSTGEERKRIADVCFVLAAEISKLQSLFDFFDVAACDETNNGNYGQVDWSVGFEILLDVVARIEKMSDEVWDTVIKTLDPQG